MALFGAGGFLIAREVSTFALTAVLGGAWFAAVAAGVWALTRSDFGARRQALTLLALIGALLAIWGAWTTLMDRTVDESLASGTEVASAEFESLVHPTEGTAKVVETGDGRKLQLEDFETDPGPDLRVYLVAGSVEDESDVKDYEDLGPLKGNKGNQQYDLKDIDPSKYSTVVIWCRAFTVTFGKAELAS